MRYIIARIFVLDLIGMHCFEKDVTAKPDKG